MVLKVLLHHCMHFASPKRCTGLPHVQLSAVQPLCPASSRGRKDTGAESPPSRLPRNTSLFPLQLLSKKQRHEVLSSIRKEDRKYLLCRVKKSMKINSIWDCAANCVFKKNSKGLIIFVSEALYQGTPHPN